MFSKGTVRGVVIIGNNGCGKGTQALMLRGIMPESEHGRVVHHDTGERFRTLRDKPVTPRERELGAIVGPIMALGEHVPDLVTIEVFSHDVGHLDRGSYVIDGFPRNEVQTDHVCSYFLESDLEPVVDRKVVVVHADVPHDECLCRLIERARKKGRDDDKSIAVIKRRLELSAHFTPRIIERFEARGIRVIKVHGSGPIESVHDMIVHKTGPILGLWQSQLAVR